MWKESWTKMRRKEGRFGKSLYEDVSVRKPRIHYEEFPDILDADGNAVDPDSDPEHEDYTFKAKIIRTLLTRKNEVIDPVYLKEDAYLVFFKEDSFVDFIDTVHEILWHKHVEKSNGNEKPDLVDLQDTDTGVLTVESIEETRGQTRIFCQWYNMA